MTDEHSQDPAEAPATAADPSGEADSPLTALEKERDDLYDRLLRKTAEFDNYRKRVERERRDQADHAVTDLLLEVLHVADDFDRALSTEPEDSTSAYRKGVELIHAKLHELLRRRGVQPMDVIGRDFDPNLHQAVSYESSPGARDGEVIGELQR
ncbi:MAG: nucleotide exchange factor GrpE, partial [Vicinamibacterales bacterium]